MSNARNDPVEALESVLALAKFGRLVSRKLTSVRYVHESDEQTLDRVIGQALKTLCRYCGGDGRQMVVDGPCRECNGTGERAYDPGLKPVREVMES